MAKPIIEKTAKQLKQELISKGFKFFDYIDDDTQDTIIM
jgi:hypothetical protein